MDRIDFYSNENFPLDMVTALRELGYNVLTSYEAGQANQGIPEGASRFCISILSVG